MPFVGMEGRPGEEGVRTASDSELRGRVQESRSAPTNAGPGTPGKGALRGEEPNTAMTDGKPTVDQVGTRGCNDLAVGGNGWADPQRQAESNG